MMEKESAKNTQGKRFKCHQTVNLAGVHGRPDERNGRKGWSGWL